MKLKPLLLIGLLPLSISGFSQTDSQSNKTDSLYNISTSEEYFEKVHFYVQGNVGIPSKELEKAINNEFGNLGVGFAAGILFNPLKKPSPILVGIDFSYLTYGVDKIAQTATSPALKTSFNVYSINAAGRFLLGQKKKFTPFIDGMIGAKIFNTRTRIDKDASDIILNTNQPEVLNTTNDTGLNYGLGIGFYNRKVKNGENDIQGSFSMRFIYIWGDEAKYVVRDSIKLDSNNNVTFETGYTRTNMFLIQFGFVLY